MFGKLRLIGRGARAPEGSRAGGKSAPRGRTATAAQLNAPDLEKVSAPKALAARVLANRAAWRNAVPRPASPTTNIEGGAPRPAVTEPQPPKGAATWDHTAHG